MPNKILSKLSVSLSKKELIGIIMEQTKQIEFLIAEVAELRARLKMNSNNSSKPPSSDGYGKKKTDRSLREKGMKARG